MFRVCSSICFCHLPPVIYCSPCDVRSAALCCCSHKLRRVLRRALHLCENTFYSPRLLSVLADRVTEMLGPAFPELHLQINNIQVPAGDSAGWSVGLYCSQLGKVMSCYMMDQKDSIGAMFCFDVLYDPAEMNNSDLMFALNSPYLARSLYFCQTSL